MPCRLAQHLGRPIPNAVLVGGFAALSGLISLESVAAAIRAKFPAKLGDRNAAAAAAAFELVERQTNEVSHA